MKKTICLLLALLLMASLAACSDEGDVFTAKTYTPEDTEIRGLDIQVEDREIVVVPSEDGAYHIDYAESAEEFYEISVTDDGILTMVSGTDKDWTDFIGTSSSDDDRRITVQVPDAELATLTVSTTQEDISLPALTVTERVTLTNNGGDISFESLGAADAIAVENKNGDITGTIAGSYDDYAIACTIKKGDSSLQEKEGGTKTLTAVNNNGDIDIQLVGA